MSEPTSEELHARLRELGASRVKVQRVYNVEPPYVEAKFYRDAFDLYECAFATEGATEREALETLTAIAELRHRLRELGVWVGRVRDALDGNPPTQPPVFGVDAYRGREKFAARAPSEREVLESLLAQVEARPR